MKLSLAFEPLRGMISDVEAVQYRMALGVQPPDLIGYGVKETMKRGRNGKKW
jgi:hypothetical protein